MKISVITLHYVKNYGSVLQTYATQKTFENYGFDVQFINYVRPCEIAYGTAKISLAQKIIQIMKSFLIYIITRKNSKSNDKVFTLFISKYINLSKYYSNYDELLSSPPDADIYCTGSDQMWNSKWNEGVVPAYFLAFAPKGKSKIAYATSIGLTEFERDDIPIIQQYLKDYSHISVREKSAI